MPSTVRISDCGEPVEIVDAHHHTPHFLWGVVVELGVVPHPTSWKPSRAGQRSRRPTVGGHSRIVWTPMIGLPGAAAFAPWFT